MSTWRAMLGVMDPKNHSPMMMAPGASASSPLRFPGTSEPPRLPRLDDHLMPEDSPYEIIDGERILCMAKREHARPHAQLASVLVQVVAPGYEALVELTTRADTVPPPPDLDPEASVLPKTVQELRPDASVLREGIDPRTGDRFIEDLSFEVVNEQSMANLRKKAERLMMRGVRRVFGILVKKGQVVEWSPARSEFLPMVGEIRDPALRMPLQVRALLDAAEANNAVARALLDQGNPVIQADRLRAVILGMCDVLGIEMTPARHAALEEMHPDGLEALRAHLKSERAWPL